MRKILFNNHMFIYEKIRPNIINAFMDILNNIEFMFSIDDTLITEQTYNSPLSKLPRG